MTERSWAEEEFRESGYPLQNPMGRPIRLHSLLLDADVSEQRIIDLLVGQTYREQAGRNVLHLLGDLPHIALAALKRAADDGVTLQAAHEQLAQSTYLLQVTDPARFAKFLRLAWDLSGNEPLCWFWSHEPLPLSDLLHLQTAEPMIDLSACAPIWFRGLDGDELLMYSLA